MSRIEQIQAMLADMPDDNFLTHALALEYIKAGLAGKAFECFNANLNNNPDYVATYYHLGKLQEQAGRTEEAIRTYEQGMEKAKNQGDIHSYNELSSVYEMLIY
jgi:tetratricopeptide (TPR) repeat protein